MVRLLMALVIIIRAVVVVVLGRDLRLGIGPDVCVKRSAWNNNNTNIARTNFGWWEEQCIGWVDCGWCLVFVACMQVNGGDSRWMAKQLFYMWAQAHYCNVGKWRKQEIVCKQKVFARLVCWVFITLFRVVWDQCVYMCMVEFHLDTEVNGFLRLWFMTKLMNILKWKSLEHLLCTLLWLHWDFFFFYK